MKLLNDGDRYIPNISAATTAWASRWQRSICLVRLQQDRGWSRTMRG